MDEYIYTLFKYVQVVGLLIKLIVANVFFPGYCNWNGYPHHALPILEKEDTLSKGNMAEVAQELLDVKDGSCRASKVLLNWQGSPYVERLLGRRGLGK